MATSKKSKAVEPEARTGFDSYEHAGFNTGPHDAPSRVDGGELSIGPDSPVVTNTADHSAAVRGIGASATSEETTES